MEEKLSQKDWLMWLMFLIFIPIGIALMWVNNRYNKMVRAIVSFLYLFLFICEYVAITNGNFSGIVTLICIFVLIPYIISHWKQIFKQNVANTNMNNTDIKKPHMQPSPGLFVVAIVLMILGFYTLNNAHKNSSQNTNANKTNTVQNSSTDTANNTTEQPKEDGSMGEGMYKVGTDLQAGEYVIIINNSDTGYMQISKDSTGTLNSIVGNENISNRTYVTVNDGEYLTVKSGKIYPLDKAPKVEPQNGILPSGMYKVGTDIQAGEYKVNSTGDGYVEITSTSRHTATGILSNDIFTGDKYITIQDGQYVKLQNTTLRLNN